MIANFTATVETDTHILGRTHEATLSLKVTETTVGLCFIKAKSLATDWAREVSLNADNIKVRLDSLEN